jgi:hypothetical protein
MLELLHLFIGPGSDFIITVAYADGDNPSKKVEILSPINIVDIPPLSPIQDEGFFVIMSHARG